MNRLKDFFLIPVRKVREINKRYEKPDIEMTVPVKIALLFLRIYLLGLVGLLVYKFVLTAIAKH